MRITTSYLVVAASFLLGALVLPVQAEPPKDWAIAGDAPNDYEFGVANGDAHEGARSAYIKAKLSNSSGFGTLMQTISATKYLGKRVRLSAFLRTDNAGSGQMWMRIDGSGNAQLGFDNMGSRPITGTTSWKGYEIVLDVPRESVDIAFGVFLTGTGTVWADAFKIDVVPDSVPTTSAKLSSTPENLGFEE